MIVICNKHFRRVRFPKAAGPADADQVLRPIDPLIDQPGKSGLIDIFTSAYLRKSAVPRIKVNPHSCASFLYLRYILTIAKKLDTNKSETAILLAGCLATESKTP